MKLKIKLDRGAIMPTRAHRTDAGLDLYTQTKITIWPFDQKCIDTGVHVLIPEGYVGLLTSKSGLMRDKGIVSTGTIDAGYTGSIKAVLFNRTGRIVEIEAGKKITQLVVFPIVTPELETVDELPETDRADGGFGSSGL